MRKICEKLERTKQVNTVKKIIDRDETAETAIAAPEFKRKNTSMRRYKNGVRDEGGWMTPMDPKHRIRISTMRFSLFQEH